MTNIETTAKQDAGAARAGFRGWMESRPFRWGAIAFAAGAIIALLIRFAL